MGKKSDTIQKIRGKCCVTDYNNIRGNFFERGISSNYNPICKLYKSYVTLREIIEIFGFKDQEALDEFCKARYLNYRKEKFHESVLVRNTIIPKLNKETAKVSAEERKTYFRTKLPDGYYYSSSLYQSNRDCLELYPVEVEKTAKILELKDYLDALLSKEHSFLPVWTVKFLINTVKFLYVGKDMKERGSTVKNHILQFLHRNFVPLLETYREQKDLTAANRRLILENEKLKIINDHLSLKVDEIELTKIQLTDAQSANHSMLEFMKQWTMPYIDIILERHQGILSYKEITCLRKKIQGESSEKLALELNMTVSMVNECFSQGLRKFNNIMEKLNKSRKVRGQMTEMIEGFYINRKEASQ